MTGKQSSTFIQIVIFVLCVRDDKRTKLFYLAKNYQHIINTLRSNNWRVTFPWPIPRNLNFHSIFFVVAFLWFICMLERQFLRRFLFDTCLISAQSLAPDKSCETTFHLFCYCWHFKSCKQFLVFISVCIVIAKILS